MTRTRQNKLTVFLSDEETAMLLAMKEQTGLSSQSEVIRQLIRKGHNDETTSKHRAVHRRRVRQ